ncbi:MAG: ATP-binding protein [Chitinophagaceae bacterium]|jgi:DNA polymerase-3 subunit delta'
MLFKDVIGQQEVKQHLVEMVQHNRLSHALLFLGKEGSGALPLALAFANYVSSIPSSSEKEPDAGLFDEPVEVKLPATADEADSWMQKQSSFSKSQALVHPDIHYSYPTIKRDAKHDKPISTDFIVNWREFINQYPYGNVFDWLQFIGADNKQGNITAHECNDIIRQLNLKSFESGYKILLMWMPEYLGKEGNKLLKLIEEPPADTLFILVAESEEKILSTILSRCQLIKIPSIDSSDIEKTLVLKANCQKEQAKLLANASDGNYREALHLLHHADEDFSSLLKEWMNATLKNQTVSQVKFIEEIARLGRERQKQFLKHFTHLVEQAIRLEIGNEVMADKLQTSMSSGEYELILKMNKVMSLEQKEAISDEIEKAAYYIERNANGKILFHSLTIKIFYIVKHNVVLSV